MKKETGMRILIAVALCGCVMYFGVQKTVAMSDNEELRNFKKAVDLTNNPDMETKIYHLETTSELANADRGNAEDYFKQRGVPFPEGAKIVFDSRISRLIAVNTPDNLALIEDIVRELNAIDSQVGIKIEYLKIAESDFRDAVGEDTALNPRKLNASLYTKLKKCKKTQVAASGYVLTRNEEEATFRMVTQKYFPTDWGNPNVHDKDKNNEEKSAGTSISAFGEPTELGIRFIVSPTVKADLCTISLEISPIVQDHVGWTSYKLGKTEAKMPEFATSTNETSPIIICDGKTALFESGQRDEALDAGDKKIPVRHFTFVTASLVKPDGTFLRNPDNNNIAGKTVEKKKEEHSLSDEHIITPEAEPTVVQEPEAKISIQNDILEISYDDLEKIMSDNKISEASGALFYRTLLKSGKAKVTSQKIIATSGQTAVNRQVNERLLPTAWWTKPGMSTPLPTFEAHDLGLRFEAKATVCPNNYTICFFLNPHRREQSGWTKYPYENILNGLPEKTISEQKGIIMMPEIQLEDITTNCKIYDGETVLIGKTYLGFDPGKDSFFNFRTGGYNGKVILFFLSAMLVNSDGIPIRQ